jgi:hypothetical protein
VAVDRTTEIAVGALLVGGALWWIVARNKAAAPATPPKVDDGPEGIAAFLGVSQICVDIAKAHPQAGGICAGLEGALAAFKKIGSFIGDQFKSCIGAAPSPEDLIRFEALNRSLNGPCRAMSDELAFLSCPSTRPAKLYLVAPMSPATKTRPGLCVSYLNGCAPLTFATTRTECKPGTHIYGYGGQTHESAALAAAAYQRCLTRNGANPARPDRRRDAAAAAACVRDKPGATRQAVNLRVFPSPFAEWFGAPPSRDHRTKT